MKHIGIKNFNYKLIDKIDIKIKNKFYCIINSCINREELKSQYINNYDYLVDAVIEGFLININEITPTFFSLKIKELNYKYKLDIEFNNIEKNLFILNGYKVDDETIKIFNFFKINREDFYLLEVSFNFNDIYVHDVYICDDKNCVFYKSKI